MPPRLSPSPPVPVCRDTPVTPSCGYRLLPTTDLNVITAVEVVSLAIDAAAGVGITFGVGRITRNVEGKFSVWRLRCGGKDHSAWVRAVAARRGGAESRRVVSSGGNDAEGSASLEVEDYLQFYSTRTPPLPPDLCRLATWIHQAMYSDSLLS